MKKMTYREMKKQEYYEALKKVSVLSEGKRTDYMTLNTDDEEEIKDINPEVTETIETPIEDISKKTKAEIIEMLAEKGIEATEKMTKNDLIDLYNNASVESETEVVEATAKNEDEATEGATEDLNIDDDEE